MKIWKTGDEVQITMGGRTVVGRVLLASPNGRALALSFEAMLGPEGGGAYVGMMPVLEEDGVFRDLVTRSEVVLSEVEKGG